MTAPPLEVRRGKAIASAAHTGVAWQRTTAAAVIPKAELKELAARGDLPEPDRLTLVRARPWKAAEWAVALKVLYADRAPEERSYPYVADAARLDDEGGLGVMIAFVAGPEPLEGLALPGITLVDVTEGEAHAPKVEVSGLGAGPLPLDLEGAPQPKPPGVVRALLKGLHYETDKALLLPSAMTSIGRLKRFLASRPGLAILVVGHADTTGSAEHNLALSDERARSMLQYLKDDVDAWLGFYGQPKASKPWGRREDQLMLSALPGGGEEPHYPGAPDGQEDARHAAATKAFQVRRNRDKGAGLKEDGILGPLTRRELVSAYMDLDGQSLPASVITALHGCGEFHPEVPTADGTESPENRRVEMFLFQDSIDPAPQARCPAPGCGEYAVWKEKTTQTIDLSREAGQLTVLVTDEQDAPLTESDVSISGAETRKSRADAGGRALFADLLPGTYEVTAVKQGFRERKAKVEVLAGGGTRPAEVAAPAGQRSLVAADSGSELGDSAGAGTGAGEKPADDLKLKLPAVACRTSRARIKNLLEMPARALSLWQACHVVAHLHDERKITLKQPPSPACEKFDAPGQPPGFANRFVASIGDVITGETGRSVSFRIINGMAIIKGKKVVNPDPKTQGGVTGWTFDPIPILNVDPRTIVFLYHLVSWVTRKPTMYGGKDVRAIIHIGFNGQGGHRSDRTNKKGETLNVLHDAHLSGRALDFAGVLFGDPGSEPIADWPSFNESQDAACICVDHWGKATPLAGPGYRLAAARKKPGIDGARADLFHDVMQLCVRHMTTESGTQASRYDPTLIADDAVLATTTDAYMAKPTPGALLHPDVSGDSGQRAAHANHIHVQVGPTRYEFVTDADRRKDLGDGIGPNPDFTRQFEHTQHFGGVGVVKDVGKPPPDDNPAAP